MDFRQEELIQKKKKKKKKKKNNKKKKRLARVVFLVRHILPRYDLAICGISWFHSVLLWSYEPDTTLALGKRRELIQKPN